MAMTCTRKGWDFMSAPPRLFEVAEAKAHGPWEEDDLEDRANFQALATAEGSQFKLQALEFVQSAGAKVMRVGFELQGMPVDAEVRGPNGQAFLVLARGTPDEKKRSGFRRTDTIQKAGFVAMRIAAKTDQPILAVTSDLPTSNSKAGLYLAELADSFWDVAATRGDLRGFNRLRRCFHEPLGQSPLQAPWRGSDWRSHPNPYQEQLKFAVEFSEIDLDAGAALGLA